MRRTKSREIALQILFALESQTHEGVWAQCDNTDKEVERFLENFGPKKADEIADLPYLRRLLRGIVEDQKNLDRVLEKFSEHWKLYRMSKIDRNILRVGAEELKSFFDIPPKVTIDECVELAKRFSTDESSAFVNGILDKLRIEYKRENE
ncbi:MAG: transcription antitermination factor NusB [Oligoflexia bacterium]|nr:transcription antitermination factor NusB [Oligoflexia bacterium]